MDIKLKIKRAVVLRGPSSDEIRLIIDGDSPFPDCGYDGIVRVEAQKGIGVEYCNRVFGVDPEYIDPMK